MTRHRLHGRSYYATDEDRGNWILWSCMIIVLGIIFGTMLWGCTGKKEEPAPQVRELQVFMQPQPQPDQFFWVIQCGPRTASHHIPDGLWIEPREPGGMGLTLKVRGGKVISRIPHKNGGGWVHAPNTYRYLLGDVTQDGQVNKLDVNAAEAQLGECTPLYDIDRDGCVGPDDVEAIRANLGASLP